MPGDGRSGRNVRHPALARRRASIIAMTYNADEERQRIDAGMDDHIGSWCRLSSPFLSTLHRPVGQ